MKLSEMMQWLLQLLPQQKAKGDGNLQAGRIEGDLNNSQHSNNHTVYNFLVVSAATSAESVVTPEAPQPSQSQTKVTPLAPGLKVTQPQRDLLRFMAQSAANEARAEFFMQREFGTVRVKRLSEFECHRTTRYVEACIRRELDKTAELGNSIMRRQ